MLYYLVKMSNSKTTLKDAIPDCPEVFHDLEVLYENSWASYEDNAWIVIFKFFDEIMVEEYQYSPEAEDNSYKFDPRPIDMYHFGELMRLWDTMGDDDEDEIK